jgi:hypothetical protein
MDSRRNRKAEITGEVGAARGAPIESGVILRERSDRKISLTWHFPWHIEILRSACHPEEAKLPKDRIVTGQAHHNPSLLQLHADVAPADGKLALA